MDNVTSKGVEDFIASHNTQRQYTPTDLHITNPAERALQTYKSCVKSTMASLPPTFPISYGCRLLPQIYFIMKYWSFVNSTQEIIGKKDITIEL